VLLVSEQRRDVSSLVKDANHDDAVVELGIEHVIRDRLVLESIRASLSASALSLSSEVLRVGFTNLGRLEPCAQQIMKANPGFVTPDQATDVLARRAEGTFTYLTFDKATQLIG
jgi:hypothetical protein